jgi:ketosteroid isomerase-like protein
VVSLGTYSGTFKKTGRSISAAFAHVWTVRGDKLAKFNMHTDTAKVLEACRTDIVFRGSSRRLDGAEAGG